MDELLYKFLIQHQQLSIPGLGTIAINRVPAVDEFGSKSFIAPRYEISFDHAREIHSRKIFHWLSQVFLCNELDAVKMVNDFGFDIKQQLLLGNPVHWRGIGNFIQQQDGTIKLEADAIDMPYEPPVYMEKIVREHAIHTIRVGEEYRDSEQMSAMLAQTTGTKRSWLWIWTLIVIVLALAIIGYLFYTKGFNGNATGLQQKIKTEQPAVLHRNLP